MCPPDRYPSNWRHVRARLRPPMTKRPAGGGQTWRPRRGALGLARLHACMALCLCLVRVGHFIPNGTEPSAFSSRLRHHEQITYTRRNGLSCQELKRLITPAGVQDRRLGLTPWSRDSALRLSCRRSRWGPAPPAQQLPSHSDSSAHAGLAPSLSAPPSLGCSLPARLFALPQRRAPPSISTEASFRDGYVRLVIMNRNISGSRPGAPGIRNSSRDLEL